MDKVLRARVSLRNPLHFLALGFGSGLIPFAPGTFGSLAAIPFLLVMAPLTPLAYLLICVSLFALGVWFCAATARAMRMHDHGSIVWDEIVGMLFTFILVPINPLTLLLGFVLFRVFDILKPWPIRLFDKKVHGGFGIMIDDVVAGLIACACLHGLLYLGAALGLVI